MKVWRLQSGRRYLPFTAMLDALLEELLGRTSIYGSVKGRTQPAWSLEIVVTTKSSNQQNVGKDLVLGNSRLTEALRTPKWPYISNFHSDERSLQEELLRRTITYGSGKGWKQLALALAILVTTKSSNQQNVGNDLAPGNLRLTEGLRTPKWP